MSQGLTIGIAEPSPGWLLLLRQLGVPFENVAWGTELESRYGAIIVNRTLIESEQSELAVYQGLGGAVLDNARYLRDAGWNTSRRSRGVIVASPDDHELFNVEALEVFDRVACIDGARHFGETVFLGEHIGGPVAAIPFDIERIIISTRSRRRRFPAPGGRHPDEVVARYNKGGFRRLVESTLRWLVHRRGLPYLHLWYFPDQERNLFCFRIDTDYGTWKDIESLRSVADSNGVRVSWFLHVEAHLDKLERFRDFHGHEIGAHGFRHKTYGSYEENWGNIRESVSVMQGAGVRVRSFTAPTGRWSRNLARAMEELGFDYSSEFTLDYDDLPFYPWLGTRFSSVLQVPIHPVSVGNFQRVKATEHAMIEYYRQVMERKLRAAEPIVLYHHPLQHARGVIESIFEFARTNRLFNPTMGEYATWWAHRAATRFSASLDGETVELSRNNTDQTVAIRCIRPDGTFALLTEAGTYSMNSLSWHPPEPVQPIFPAPHSPPQWDLTIFRHSIEDYISRMRQ